MEGRSFRWLFVVSFVKGFNFLLIPLLSAVLPHLVLLHSFIEFALEGAGSLKAIPDGDLFLLLLRTIAEGLGVKEEAPVPDGLLLLFEGLVHFGEKLLIGLHLATIIKLTVSYIRLVNSVGC